MTPTLYPRLLNAGRSLRRHGLPWARFAGRLAVAVCGAAALSSAIAAIGLTAVANDANNAVRTVWRLDSPYFARFCSSHDLAVAYFRYDNVRQQTAIEVRSLSGEARSVGGFPGAPNGPSLSCSDDGDTIAALDGQRYLLFLSQKGDESIYRFSRYWAYSVVGQYSLLSPDGASIVLPERPSLKAGPDLLNEMNVTDSSDGKNRFFVGSKMYLDDESTITEYDFGDSGWTRRREINKPKGFGAYEIVRCGTHDVATLSDDESFRFVVLDENLPSDRDWLSRIGARRLLRNYRNAVVITGGSGVCAFPLHRRDRPAWLVDGVARIDHRGLKVFSFSGEQIAIAEHKVLLSKDGCYGLIMTYTKVPDIPQFTLPQEVRLLAFPAERCSG